MSIPVLVATKTLSEPLIRFFLSSWASSPRPLSAMTGLLHEQWQVRLVDQGALAVMASGISDFPRRSGPRVEQSRSGLCRVSI